MIVTARYCDEAHACSHQLTCEAYAVSESAVTDPPHRSAWGRQGRKPALRGGPAAEVQSRPSTWHVGRTKAQVPSMALTSVRSRYRRFNDRANAQSSAREGPSMVAQPDQAADRGRPRRSLSPTADPPDDRQRRCMNNWPSEAGFAGRNGGRPSGDRGLKTVLGFRCRTQLSGAPALIQRRIRSSWPSSSGRGGSFIGIRLPLPPAAS